MSDWKVCILAAGAGTRLCDRIKGINKALVSVGTAPAISHIIDSIPVDTDIVVAAGHESGKLSEYLSHAHSDRNVRVVRVENHSGPGSGPLTSLLSCKKELQCPFVVWTVDTLVGSSFSWDAKRDIVFVSKTDDASRYCCVRSLVPDGIKFFNKSLSGRADAFIGIAAISDSASFWSIAHDIKENETTHETELIDALEAYAACHDTHVEFPDAPWHDVGTIEGLEYARSVMNPSSLFDFSKPDESIYFVDGKVIKRFDDPERVTKRVQRSKLLGATCPTIVRKTKHFYSYDYVDGTTMYEALDMSSMMRFFSWCDANLWMRLELDCEELATFHGKCLEFYRTKTLSRVSMFCASNPQIPDIVHYVNGMRTPKVSELLQQVDWSWISLGAPGRIHGDLQFDNVIKTRECTFALIDWREDFAGMIDMGDVYYDIAKMYGGIIVPYSVVKRGLFSVTQSRIDRVSCTISRPNGYGDYESAFIRLVESRGFDTNRMRVIQALVFLGMSPLHCDPFDKFLFFMGKYLLTLALAES